MKKGVVFILLMIVLASCSSFSRMKYGHVRKVPAEPGVFASAMETREANQTLSADTIDAVQLVDTFATGPIAPKADSAFCRLLDPDVTVGTRSDNTVCRLLDSARSDKSPVTKTESALCRLLDPDVTVGTRSDKPARSDKLPLRLQLPTGLPPDLQLFFAIVFLCIALLALLLCIFVVPYLAGGWLWILLTEIILLYGAWKLIITAVAFLRGRFGNAKSYEEH